MAVNVASVLAREAPGEALLMDLHLAHGDAAVFLGAEPRFSVVDALENTHRLDEAFFRGLVVTDRSGPDLLASSERHVVGTPGADRVRQLIEFARPDYRYVVLDLPRSDLTILDALDAVHRIVADRRTRNWRPCATPPAWRRALRQRYGKDRDARWS